MRAISSLCAAEVLLFERYIILYKFISDAYIYVLAGKDGSMSVLVSGRRLRGCVYSTLCLVCVLYVCSVCSVWSLCVSLPPCSYDVHMCPCADATENELIILSVLNAMEETLGNLLRSVHMTRRQHVRDANAHDWS